jgi:hypothetical protein
MIVGFPNDRIGVGGVIRNGSFDGIVCLFAGGPPPESTGPPVLCVTVEYRWLPMPAKTATSPNIMQANLPAQGRRDPEPLQ